MASKATPDGIEASGEERPNARYRLKEVQDCADSDYGVSSPGRVTVCQLVVESVLLLQ